MRRAAALQGEQAAILVAAQAEVEARARRRLRTTRRGAQGYANAAMPARAADAQRLA